MSDIESNSSLSDDLSIFDTDTELDESSGDDLLDLKFVLQKPTRKDYFEQTIATYSDKEFLRHFRVNRDVVNEIVEQFKNSKQFTYQSGNYGKLTPLKFVLAFLWFAGHQTASFRDIAKRFRITTSSLFRVITRMSEFLNDQSPQIIKWPDAEEICNIEKDFRHNRGFPGVVGVVDVQQILTSKIVRMPNSPLQRKGLHFFQVRFGFYFKCLYKGCRKYFSHKFSTFSSF